MDKIAFLDVDGTLTTGKSSWEKVHLYFDLEREMEENSKKYFSGEIAYNEWANLDVGLWKGKPVEEVHNAVNPPELIEGAREGVKKLQEAGYKVILISGGIDIMVNSVCNLVQADDAYSNIIGVTNGIVDGTIHHYVGNKSMIINKLIQSNNYSLVGSIAIGDHVNDIEMFEIVDYAVAFNPKDENIEKVADDVYRSANFEEVVDYILSK